MTVGPAPAVPFGRYLLRQKLAIGGMAEVYLAEYRPSERVSKRLVIKKILPSFAQDPEFVQMFEEEARIAAGLSHGNIAQVFDYGQIEGQYFLALEYVHGHAVDQVLDRAKRARLRIPAEYGCFIALEMCKGLHHAHTLTGPDQKPLGLVHRDISPQNVLISFEGQVKLVDFGIAKAYGQEELGRSKTATGMVKGKYKYFSPEQALALRLDARSDVYATGVVLYEMISGQRPFNGTVVEVLGQITRGQYPRMRVHDPSVPAELEGIVERAMATDPSRRYPSALALQEALTGFLSGNAPRFTQASLAHLMRYLYRPELRARGEDATLPSEVERLIESWQVEPGESEPPLDLRSSDVVESRDVPRGWSELARGRPETAITPRVQRGFDGIERTRRLVLIALVVLCCTTLGAVAAAAWMHRSRGAERVVIPIAEPIAAPTAPAGPLARVAAPPTSLRPSTAAAPALPSLVVPPPPRENRFVRLEPSLLGRHDGRVVPHLRCSDGTRDPAVEPYVTASRQAAADGRYEDAIALADQAIAVEPTAGELYDRLAELAEMPDHVVAVRLVMRDLESFLFTCQGDARGVKVRQALNRMEAQAAAAAKAAPPEPLPPLKKGMHPGRLSAARIEELRRFRQEARERYEAGDYDAAKFNAWNVVAADSTDAEMWRLLARCAAAMGRPDEAARDYQRFLELAPRDPEAPRIKEALKAIGAAAHR